VTPCRWLPLRDAAALLSMSPAALRKQCERHQQLASDGAIEARFDGLLARKVGNRWRIALSDLWAQGPVLGSASQKRDRRGRKEVGT
jgi:hypothetical protein